MYFLTFITKLQLSNLFVYFSGNVKLAYKDNSLQDSVWNDIAFVLSSVMTAILL